METMTINEKPGRESRILHTFVPAYSTAGRNRIRMYSTVRFYVGKSRLRCVFLSFSLNFSKNSDELVL